MADKLKATVGQIAPGIFRTRWSPRILSIFDANRRKDIVYVAFSDMDTAVKFRQHVMDRGIAAPYSRETDSGICKPRKSERLTDYPLEVKWHRPDLDFMENLIRRDVRETEIRAKAAAARADLGI